MYLPITIDSGHVDLVDLVRVRRVKEERPS